MELLIIDPFEASTPGLSNRPASMPFFADVKGDHGTGSRLFALTEGVLSPVALRASTNGADWLSIGPSTLQESGKAVWGCAFQCDLDATRTIMGIPTGNSNYSYITISTDREVNFLGQSETIVLDPTDWGYFEVVLDLSNEVFEVFFNSTQILSGSHSFDSLRNEIYLGSQSGSTSSNYRFFDDFYHLGGTTGQFTDRLGPVRAIRAPLDTSADTNFTPTGAPNNLAAVNKTSLAEGSYNRSPASNDVSDRFRIDTSVIPEGKDILGVSHRIYYRKSDIGPRNLDAVVTGPSGANKVSQPLPERLVTFGGHDPMILTKAPGGGALDIEALEDMEFGYEVKA